ncbi:Testis-specific serine/threonine-protein kinase 5 [Pteropus alecto]|uniref:non-specific serine/threonine protein kinase n=1 Tax=Pteropus alecto TaxID=9402 RepID=L5KJI2_PTEAL|nr:Testis-specific serine/threonine-protein kinase 5 [Pteropus alecto]
MKHNLKLVSNLRGKHHAMVAIKIVSMAEAPVEFSRKFLPREISSLSATYKHLNVVQVYETYNSQRSYLVLELGGRSDLLENINMASGRRSWRRRRPTGCPGSCSVPWPTATTWGSCTVGTQGWLLSTFCSSMAYTAPQILVNRKYSGEQANLWSLSAAPTPAPHRARTRDGDTS